jgi:nucleoside-diphosphate-sugar epimerase
MKILLTGASSFTGYWFASQFTQAGHEVHATFTRSDIDSYTDGVRRHRVQAVANQCTPVFGCRFGDTPFFTLLESGKFDVLCHHAADVTNYRDPNFDVTQAVANNTNEAKRCLELFAARGGRGLIVTGSVFEGGEGAGSDGLPAFSPYGLSKQLTAGIFEYYAGTAELPFGKFVIPNPFGPWEESRFTAYLMRCWSQGEVAAVQTPAYIRDNIHVSLLSLAYVAFVEKLTSDRRSLRLNPSGYVESQGQFAERVAREVRARTGWPCRLELRDQLEFAEPRERFNVDRVDGEALGWREAAAWDKFVAYYEHEMVGGNSSGVAKQTVPEIAK